LGGEPVIGIRLSVSGDGNNKERTMITITLSIRDVILIVIALIIGWSVGGFLNGFLVECWKNYKELRTQKLWEKKHKK